MTGRTSRPSRPWRWRQTWHDLLFLHWPVATSILRPLVPERLEIEEREGSAWVGVIPFWMSGVAMRPLPPVPGASHFPELNVRTYVRHGDRPGVWFFSLDAANRLAVWVARTFFHLPYVFARMEARRNNNGIAYRSRRPDGPAFEGTYAPVGKVALTEPDSLEHWFTERYCLYSQSARGQIHRADIHHAQWPLQPAEAEIRHNDMLTVHGIEVDGPAPHQHYAKKLEVLVWSLKPISS